MDQAVLVNQAHELTRLLDDTTIKPRAVMWVHQPDSNTWKLWITPDRNITDKREFYRIVAETISSHAPELSGIDVGSTEYVQASHPAISGMGRFIRLPGIGNVYFSGNKFNDFFLPDGIVIRMDV